jgi:septal ring factor EnvC (AmiA/AmiB activator)
MGRANKALVVLVVASLGLWGCARGPANGSVSVERIRALEAKIAKLEDDFRASVAVRDQLRKKLATAEEERTQVNKERDDLRQQLGAVQDRFDQFRKGVKGLLGQAEQPVPTAAQPVTSASEPAVPGRS